MVYDRKEPKKRNPDTIALSDHVLSYPTTCLAIMAAVCGYLSTASRVRGSSSRQHEHYICI